VQPGVCGAVTTGRTHWAAAQFATAELMGRAENAVRAEMDSAAAVAGLKAIVNVVLNTRNEIVGCFCGDPVAAHRAACQLAEEVYRGDLPGLADIVIIESYPSDLDLWQASKALAASEIAVKPHGVVILVAPCPEGVSCEHPAFLDYGYRSPAEVADWVSSGAMTDLIVAAELAIGGRVIKERAKGIMVSTGITTEAIRQLGLTPAASPQEALDMAFHLIGQDAQVLVVRHGGEILPIVHAH
jgi:nickel-dependent lactate racemase